MTLDEVDLQLRQLFAAHADIAERTEAGGDAVDGFSLRRNLLVQIKPTALDAAAGVVAERQEQTVLDDFADAFNGEVLGRDEMSVHSL